MPAEQRDPPSRVANAPPGDPRPTPYAKTPVEKEGAHLPPQVQHWLALLRLIASLPPAQRGPLFQQLFSARGHRPSEP